MTALDTNVLVALLSGTVAEAEAARRALERALETGPLVIPPVVYAELVAAPGRGAEEVDALLNRAGIDVEWNTGEAVWRAAAAAFRGYAERRRSQPRDEGPRRLLADFVVGAHAEGLGATLLTLDRRLYAAAFPSLAVVSP